MEIIRIKEFAELHSERMANIERMFNMGFAKELTPRKFSWRNFTKYWEIALRLPWNALWVLIDEEEENVHGLIGGCAYDDIVTGERIAQEVCWRTADYVKGKGLGWELFVNFIEWAIKEQNATRILAHRSLSKDPKSDDYFDSKIREHGFLPRGFDYYFDVKE